MLQVRLVDLAKAFSVEVVEDQSTLVDSCFEEAYKACQNKQWELIESFRDELTILTNSVGHTLLIRSLIRKDDAVVTSLCERKIGVMTADPMGHGPLGYLRTGMCGDRTSDYERVICQNGGVLQGKDQAIEESDFDFIDFMVRNIRRGGDYGRLVFYLENSIGQLQERWGSSLPYMGAYVRNIGMGYHMLGDPSKAVCYFEWALALLKLHHGEDHPHYVECLSSTGRAYADIPGGHGKCAQYYKQALELASEDLAVRHADFAFVCMNTENFAVAIEHYKKAIEYAEKMKAGDETSYHPRFSERERQKQILEYEGCLASCYCQYGRNQEGIALFGQVMPKIVELYGEDSLDTFTFSLDHGRCYMLSGMFSEAEKIFLQLLDMKSISQTGFAQVHDRLGLVYTDTYKYKQAEQHFQKAVDIYQSDQLYKLVGVLNNLGNLYASTGRFDLAEATFLKAKSHLEAMGGKNDPQMRKILCGLMELYTSWGAVDKAAELDSQLESAGVVLEGGDGSLWFFLTIGNRLHQKGDFENAKDHYVKALEIAEKGSSPKMIAILLKNLGSCCNNLGHLNEAKSYLIRALDLVRGTDQHEDYGCFLEALGNTCTNLKEFKQAIEYLSEAIVVLQKVDSRWLGRAYINLGCIYGVQGDNSRAEELFRQAVITYEAIRVGVVADKWQITVFDELYNAYRYLEQILLLQKKWGEALIASDLRRAKSLNALMASRIFQDTIDASLHVELNVRELAKEHNATIVMFSLSKQEYGECTVWMFSPSGEFNVLSMDEASISDTSIDTRTCGSFPLKTPETEEIIAQFEGNYKTLNGLTPEQVEKLKALREQFNARLAEWYEILIKPLRRHLPEGNGEKVIFIPDQELSTVPFNLLKDEDGRFLFEKFAITVVPSMTTLLLLKKRRESEGVATNALIIDDPLPGKGSLKTSGEESRRFAKLIGANTILRGERATASRVTEEMEQSGWVHFSCHGSNEISKDSSKHSVYRGHLCLFKDKDHKEGDLLADEIVSRKMRADMVVMSACSTGIGTLKKDGLIGLVRSFLGAGASCVLASHWRVSDSEITVQMMERFYQCLTNKEPMSKAEALREAMLLGKQIDPEAIERWGVFFLTGLDIKYRREPNINQQQWKSWSLGGVFTGIWKIFRTYLVVEE